MRKKMLALVMAVSFLGASSGAALASKYCKGTVKEFDGKTMVIEIDGKCKCKVGDAVKVKPSKKKAVEGC